MHGFHSVSPVAGRHGVLFVGLAVGALAPSTGLAGQAPNGAVAGLDTEERIEELLVIGSRVEESAARLRAVPGGTDFINAEEFRSSVTISSRDVLKLTPGVFAQSRFGNAETRISIRGSGIAQTFGLRGVMFLRDGLPLNDADGFFNSELVEPLNARFVEVYRGANALEFGSSTLGGAVNFVTHTGRSAPGLTALLSGGSDDFIRTQLSSGMELGAGWDVFASFSGQFQEGFRPNSEEDALRFFVNLGRQHSPGSETRLRVAYQDNELELAGALTKAQLRQDPTQANPFWDFMNAARNQDIWRVELYHREDFGADNRLDLNAFYETGDFFHPLPFFVQTADQRDIGASLRHQVGFAVADFPTRLVWGARLAYGDDRNDRFAAAGMGARGDLIRIAESEAFTGESFFELTVSPSEAVNILIGNQLSVSERNSNTSFGNGITDSKTYVGVSPKLGATWTPWRDRDFQFFGNVSRSFEPPTNGEFSNADIGIVSDQTATTVEIGLRGTKGAFTWDIAAFHAWLDDEILSIELPPLPSGNFATGNADDTRHFGVELGAGARLPLSLFGDDALEAQVTYTFNRFVFDNDPAFGDNEIPGLPNHFGRAELAYVWRDRIRISVIVNAADDYFVDFANTLEADSYATVDLRLNVALDEDDRFSFFLEGRNIGDKAFVATASLLPDAGGRDASVFNPGRDRTVFAGLEARF